MLVLKGRLLVATPLLGDPNFERAVILVLEHNDDGALGVVLNRPTDVELLEPLPGWNRFAGEPGVVFLGGPVSRNAVIALARAGDELPTGTWEPVLDRLGVLDLTTDPDTLGDELDTLRVFAGYAGWGPEQLEAEIDEGAWYVVDADPGDAFTHDPQRLWRRVLSRQGGELARAATVPDDPRLN
ncbi:MAG: YqgE/AlgH family protein [Acidimicrobiales bacterium]